MRDYHYPPCGGGGTCVANGNLLKITSPNGRWIAFTYGLSACPTCVTQVTDNAGRTLTYTYDQFSRLIKVQDPSAPTPGVTTYGYDGASDRILAICDPRWNTSCPDGTCGSPPLPGAICTRPPPPTLAIAYVIDASGNGTVKTQTLADGSSTYNFTYQMASRCEFGTSAGNSCTTNADCTQICTNGLCTFGPNAGHSCTTNADCPNSVPAGGICFSTSTQTAVKDPRNYYRVVQFGFCRGGPTPGSGCAVDTNCGANGTCVTTGYSTSDAQGATNAQGTDALRTVRYGRLSGSNLLSAITEPLASTCRQTAFGYDPSGNGNLLTLTRFSGPCPNGNSTTLTQTTFTYEPTFNQLASIQTPAGTTYFNYGPGDPLVRLSSITDGSGLVFPVVINSLGQLASISDPLGHATTFTYDGPDLLSVTDATNNTTQRLVDAAGRVRNVTDALGRVTQYSYDNLNHLTQVTDPLGGLAMPTPQPIVFGYDQNGNLTRVTDNRHSPTAIRQYFYNSLNQLIEQTTPLPGVDTFTYDALGNLLTYKDHKNVYTDFGYDALNRRTCAGFQRLGSPTPDLCGTASNYTSVIGYGYDTGSLSRLTQATDSVSGGSITRQYDDLDNLKSETTPQGAVNYVYDAASRRETMQVAGQPMLRYCYDGAGRLTKIVQPGTLLTVCPAASGVVNVAYDGAGRRNVVFLPNLDRVTYNYDNASRVSSLQYNVGGTVYGLTYTYDPAGNRTQQGSDWARTGLPAAMSSASYDLADELQTWNGTALPSGAFYLDGELAKDGTNTYAWNARQQLTGITVTATGAPVASFAYDAFGRRTSKTVGGVITNFLYDGLNPVQELVGGTVTANLLTGLGIDEVFRRSTISGGTTTNRSFFPDALGSTVALSDDNETLQTQYRYEPFGQETLVSGSPSDSNPYQFTGRENDSVCQGGTNAGQSCTSNADCPGTGGTCVSTGLYYYRARYYKPTWGRFISDDPLGIRGGDTNLYLYARDTPLMAKDPTGLLLYVCSRTGEGPFSVANHAYFFDTNSGLNCGKGGSTGKGGNTGNENPATPGTVCFLVPGASNADAADAINCCQLYNSLYIFTPFQRDCQKLIHSCLGILGLRDPGVPGGYFGNRCQSACQ